MLFSHVSQSLDLPSSIIVRIVNKAVFPLQQLRSFPFTVGSTA